MSRRVARLLTLLCLFTFSARSQQATETPRQPRILLLLDGSSSMLQPWSGKDIRFKAASQIIEGLMDSIYAVNPGVEFGLRVYGHQSPAQDNDCYDSRMEVIFSKNNITQMGLRLASLRPFGVSPIAYSLQQAAENDLLDDARNAYSIILITDGGESCGGNICEVVKKLIERKIYFRPYIVSLVDYAPLKDQYACLGSYLQVSKPGDIAPAINQIVDAYRPILSMPIMASKESQVQPAVQRPAAVPVTIPTLPPPVPRTAETTAVLRIAALHILDVPARYYFRIAPRRLEVPPSSQLRYTPEPRQPERIPDQIAPADMVTTRTGRPAGNKPVPFSVVAPGPLKPPADTPKPPVVQKRDTAKPPVAQVRRDTPATTRTPVDTPRRPVVKMTALKQDSMKPVAAAKSKPVPPKPVEPEVQRSTEAAPETQLSVYFTDGRGKFYSSTPQLRLVDANTNKQVKQFYRTVDPNGNPDPQAIPAGTYNLIVASRSNMLLKKVVVEEHKNNKIIIRVAHGSLRFRYDNNPDRPVTEFNAIVNIRFEDGPINQKQKCSEELEYAPGNYHIEINTLPVYQLNTDIDFGAITQIDIPEPGYVQFTNTNVLGPVQLFSPLGNQFMRFYGLRITGNPDVQRVRLLPGVYEVHWTSNANTPRAKQEVMRFNIRSNMETSIELN